jgi:hypothetical protein
MTLGQFKDKIEELEKAGLVTDDFELVVDEGDRLSYDNITSLEIDNELIRLITMEF